MDDLHGGRALDVPAREGEALAVRRGMDRHVPACPGWTPRDLARHLAGARWQRGEQSRRRHQERAVHNLRDHLVRLK